MKFFKHFTLLFLLISATSFAQKIISHKVKSGESIYSIAKKYDIKEGDIYELNPKLKGKVLALKTEIKVPNNKFKNEVPHQAKDNKKNVDNIKVGKPKEVKKEIIVSTPEENITANSNLQYLIHLVKTKETLYSISKQYGIAMETICELNSELKTGNLKVGSKLKLPNTKHIPDSNEEVIIEPKPVNEAIIKENESPTVFHKVLPKETLYKISKKYNVSIEKLKSINPTMPSNLPVGYNLIINKGIEQNIETPIIIAESASTEMVIQPIALDHMEKADVLITKSSQYIGSPYHTGGTSSAGFDCSGLMCTTFKEIELTLPRTSKEQSNFGITIDKRQAQKGDLIFFSTNGRGNINHVGMITEILDDEIKFIHASIHAGVIVSSTKEEYYAKRFKKINRVIGNKF